MTTRRNTTPQRLRSTTTRDRHRKRQPPHRCNQCGATGVPLRQDHIVNLAAGGRDTIANLQWLCDPCHHPKSEAERLEGIRRARVTRGGISRRNRDHEPHPGQL